MDGLYVAGIAAVFLFGWLTLYALGKAAAEGDKQMEQERFFMQMEAFNWPERGES